MAALEAERLLAEEETNDEPVDRTTNGSLPVPQ